MKVISEKVLHRQFGYGTVIAQNQGMITVQFAESYGVKKFLCPAAFGDFLTFCSSALQETMDTELEQIRVQKELERKQREEEVARQQEEERKALLKLKRSSAKKRTSAKTTKKSSGNQ